MYALVEQYAKDNRRSINNAFDFLLEKVTASLTHKYGPSPQSEPDETGSGTGTQNLEKNSGSNEPLPPENSRRSLRDILDEIEQAKADRDEELAVCQDQETGNQIRGTWQIKIDELWQEYHMAKGGQ